MPLSESSNGIVNLPSDHSVAETIDRLQSVLESKGVKVFARIDQQREAKEVGLTLRPTELLMFGNPKAGTPLMQASPSVAIDLPLKVVAWQDEGGKVWVMYNDPAFLQRRHFLPDELMGALQVVRALVDQARS